jgi:hypothetical protein
MSEKTSVPIEDLNQTLKQNLPDDTYKEVYRLLYGSPCWLAFSLLI